MYECDDSAEDDAEYASRADAEPLAALEALDRVESVPDLLAWARAFHREGAGNMRCPHAIHAELVYVASQTRPPGPADSWVTCAFVHLPRGKGHARPARVAKVEVDWRTRRVLAIVE